MRTRACHLVRQATPTIAIGLHEDRIVAGDASRSGFGPTKFGRRHALPADECTAEIPETVVAKQERDFLQAELARLHALDRQRVAHAFEDLAIRRSVVGQSPEQGARQRGDRYAECAGVGIDAGTFCRSVFAGSEACCTRERAVVHHSGNHALPIPPGNAARINAATSSRSSRTRPSRRSGYCQHRCRSRPSSQAFLRGVASCNGKEHAYALDSERPDFEMCLHRHRGERDFSLRSKVSEISRRSLASTCACFACSAWRLRSSNGEPK